MATFEQPKIHRSVSVERDYSNSEILEPVFQVYLDRINTQNSIGVVLEALEDTHLHSIDIEKQDYVRGCLAHLLEKSYYLAFTSGTTTADFMKELQLGMASTHNVPGYLREGHERELKRQPSFFESIEGTLERFTYIEKLPEIFRKKVEGIIVGGSMSYGPFFNIRQNLDSTGSSDIDAIFVVKGDFFNNDEWELFDQSDLFVESDKAMFHERRKKFSEFYLSDQVDVFSQRFDVPNHDFNMSTHFFTYDRFQNMCGGDFIDDLNATGNKVKTLRDYKAKRFEHATCNQLNFFGEVFPYTVPDQVQVSKGFVAEIPSYVIQDGKLYPGLYQNLISPEFLVFYDNTGAINEMVEIFRDSIGDRITRESHMHSQKGSLKRSHFRNQFFAPGRY